MNIYLEDHYGEKIYKKVTKVEWLTLTPGMPFYNPSEPEIRMIIHFENGDMVSRHIDDIVKIEGE
jgi:hypothetical protein